jgi:pyridoxine 5-phosphate synthase
VTVRARHQRLYVNIDHVATLRQARRGFQPDVVAAAIACEDAGADGITAHLREDRRHIQDSDVSALRDRIRRRFNLEIACTTAMIDIACDIRPDQVTLVPERREEITTEGGLDPAANPERLRDGIRRLRERGIRTSLFIDPQEGVVRASRELDPDAVELHTGRYSRSPGDRDLVRELARAAKLAADLGLAVHAGHGLSAENVAPVSAIAEVEELNIGHAIVSTAVFVGLQAAVRQVREAMNSARGEGLAIPAP